MTPTLPTWAAPPVMQAAALDGRAGSCRSASPRTRCRCRQLSTIAYWKIRARLLRVPGVVNVAIWGERLQQEHVNVDPARMKAQNVSLDEVMNATADSLDAGLLRYADFGNVIGTGGWVDTAEPATRHPARPAVRAGHATWQSCPISSNSGKTVRLGDVADVVQGPQPLIGDAVVNSGPGLLLVLEKSPEREHAEGHQGHRRRARRPAARPSRRRSSTPTSSVRRTSSSSRSTTSSCR